MEVDAALKAAATAFKAGRFGDVIAPLEAALVSEPAGARSSSMHYYLGVAYAKANDLVKATNHLQFAIVADGEHDDARFQLASALDRSGQYARARGEYDRFATAHPQSPLAVFAMRRSGTLARMPAVAPPPPAPAKGAPGAASKSVPATAPGAAPAPGAPTVPTTGSVPATGAAPPPPAAAVKPAPKAAPAKPAPKAPARPVPAKPAPAEPVELAPSTSPTPPS